MTFTTLSLLAMSASARSVYGTIAGMESSHLLRVRTR